MKNISIALIVCASFGLVGCGGETATSNSPSNTIAVNKVDTSAQPTANSNAPIEMANSQRGVSNTAGATDTGAAKPMVQPAPENSEFTMELTDVGTETRTFKDHPQLDKVVRTVKPGSSNIKVYLKNGKVVDVAGDKIKNLKTVSTLEILAAVGVKPPPPPPAEAKKEDPNPPTKQP